MTISTGIRLGRYEIRSQLGKGGMGEVYLAQDTKLERKVALKIFPAELTSNQDRMRRFTREAKAAAALNHPNIAHIYEIGENEGIHFIAMEFIDGVTLRAKIHREQADLKKLLRYLHHTAEGLAKAHAAGIVHRDLKPDNIMITGDGHAKILDFGLAKLIEPLEESDGDELASEMETAVRSTPGVVRGTVGYMSPEQARGDTKAVDHRSDIFSFGCLLYDAATRQRAFAGQDSLDSLHKIAYGPTPSIKDVNPDAPDDLQRIIRRCLAKDPDERYQTIKDVAIELKELRRELPDRTLEITTTQASGIGVPAITTTISPSETASSTANSSARYIVDEIKRHQKGAILIAALTVIAVVGSIVFVRYRGARALTEKDTILLTDFVNTTGDSVFDGTLKQALAVQLGQSPFLNIFSEDRVREALKFMGRSPDERVTRDVAREICQRQGLKAMLVGSIATLGNHYVITLDAINAQTGDAIAREQAESENKEQVLHALSEAAMRLREK